MQFTHLGTLGLLSLVVAGPVCAGDKSLPTPTALWKDFDPQVGEFDEQILRRWQAGGANYKEVYFNAFVNGHKVRVYGVYAAPQKPGKYPALLHMHGGGQTIGWRWFQTWTSRGYAMLSINCHGKWPNRKRYTIYPEELKQGNHRDAGAMLKATQPSLKASSWYIWAAVNRRALTYLAGQKQVDANRLGIFGISMGGTSVWNVAIDKRVKAACAIYGVGWNERTLFAEKFNKKKKRPAPTLKQRIWNSGMAPQAYPPHIRCPMLFLNASNDQHGNLDYVFDTMQRLPKSVPWRVAITPQFRHHIGRDEGRNLLLWMDRWLKNGPAWPRNPMARLSLDREGIPILNLEADTSQKVRTVRVFYNVGQHKSKTRHWREASAVRDGPAWRARLPMSDASQNLVAFANVYYTSGVCLTAPLVTAIPSELGNAKATEKPSLRIYDGSMAVRGWTTQSPGTDPIPPIPVPLLVKTGPDGKRGIAPDNQHRRLMTYRIGDPKWRAPKDAVLRFKVYSPTKQSIVIKVADAVVSRTAKEFAATVSLNGDRGWQTVDLPLGRFHAVSGEGKLATWENLVVLWILPAKGRAFTDARLILTDFEWRR